MRAPCLIAFACAGLSRAVEESVLVGVAEGRLEGRLVTEEDGFKWRSFRGVPYAKPPVRERRFAPEPVEPWPGLRSAREWGPRCVQSFIHGPFYPPGLPESEDCLSLNVFAPSETKSKTEPKTPVLVWIHGGGFSAGCAMEYPGVGNLLRRGVVVVSVQYRLGVLGFWASEGGAEGNWALWDLTLGLQWVQRNIGAFGGDPSSVTVVGESAGAGLASLLSLSPHSSALFQRLVLMSGFAAAPWAGSEKVTEASRWLAREVGCDVPSQAQVLMCLRATEASSLTEALLRLSAEQAAGLGFFPGTKMVFVPSLKGEFLPKPLQELLKEAPPKPTIIGTTKDELAFFVRPPMPLVDTPWTVSEPKNFTFHRFRALLRDLIPDRASPKAAAIRGEALEHYVYSQGDKRDGEFLVRQFIRLLNDALMFLPSLVEAKARSSLGWPVQVYQWTHFRPADFPPGHDAAGALHGAELDFLFERTLFRVGEHDQRDAQAAGNLADLFTDFVRKGQADAAIWPLFDAASQVHLDIGAEVARKTDYADEASLAFWERVTEGDLDLLLKPPYGESEAPLGDDVDEYGNSLSDYLEESETPEEEVDEYGNPLHDEL